MSALAKTAARFPMSCIKGVSSSNLQQQSRKANSDIKLQYLLHSRSRSLWGQGFRRSMGMGQRPGRGCGVVWEGSGDFGRAQIACHGSGALFHGSGALFHGSGALFHGPVSGPLHQQMASKRPQKTLFTLFCIKITPKTLHTPQNACFPREKPCHTTHSP